MKHLFRYFAPILLCAVLASCDFESYVIDPLTGDISVSTQEITLESTGSQPATFDVTAAGDWLIVAPEGLKVDPRYGSGPATITVSAPDNVDEVWHEVQGPRSFKISVCGTGTVIPITVNQKGEAGLDASRTYSKITKVEDFESGMGYLVVTEDPNGKFQACGQVPASKSYAYPALVEVEGTEESFTLPDASKALTFVGTADSFLIRQTDGRYWYQTGTFVSFNVTNDPSTEGCLFRLSFAEDGTVRIVNIAKEKTLMCVMKAAGASYDEYKSDVGLDDGCKWPFLYKDSKVATDEVLTVSDVTVDATATSVQIPVTSNAATGWRVRCHDDWVKSFTRSGQGNGTIRVEFDANTSYDTAREAEILVLGETTGVKVKLTQQKYVPSITLEPEALSVAADVTTASFAVKANTSWTVTCPAGMTAEPASGEGNATVVLTFAPNTDEADKSYVITVTGSDSHLAVKEHTLTLTQKGAASDGSFTAAEILAAAKNTEVLMKNVIVTLVYAKGFFVQDKTGGHVLCFQNAAPSVKVGDKVNVSGKISPYSNINQIGSPVAEVLSSGNSIPWPTLAQPTAAQVDAFSNSAPGYLYAKVTVKLTDGKNFEGKMEGGSTTINITYDNAVTKPANGATVTLTGYFYGHYNKAYFYATAAE